MSGPRGERNGKARLNEDIVRHARQQHDDGRHSWVLLAKFYNVDPSTLSKACRGKTWPHVVTPEPRIEEKMRPSSI